MRPPGALSCGSTKQRSGARRATGSPKTVTFGPSGFQATAPGVPSHAFVHYGSAKIKDVLRYALWPVIELADAVYALSGAPGTAPTQLYFAKNHRREILKCGRHASRYLAVLFLAPACGLPMEPVSAWCKNRLANDDGSKRAELEKQCLYNDDGTGICGTSMIIRA